MSSYRTWQEQKNFYNQQNAANASYNDTTQDIVYQKEFRKQQDAYYKNKLVEDFKSEYGIEPTEEQLAEIQAAKIDTDNPYSVTKQGLVNKWGLKKSAGQGSQSYETNPYSLFGENKFQDTPSTEKALNTIVNPYSLKTPSMNSSPWNLSKPKDKQKMFGIYNLSNLNG